MFSSILPPQYAGDAQAQADAQQRLDEFRERHKRMGFFYQLLDIGWGMELAADDVARHNRGPAVMASMIVSCLLGTIFTLIWIRYDLVSTWNTLNPVATGLVDTLNSIIPASWGLTGPVSFVGGILEFFIRLLVTFGPTLIQVGMPYMASRHSAAWIALWLSAVFDMATDSVDVRADVPNMFGWLQTMAQDASQQVWIALIILGIALFFFKPRQRMVWAGLIVVGFLCAGWGQASNVIFWSNVGFWTFFASFAAQSLAFIFVAKTIMLRARLSVLNSAEAPLVRR